MSMSNFRDYKKNIGPQHCPHFQNCSAPVCPLDILWKQRTHRSGEPVCLWLREAAKKGGIERVARAATDQIAAKVAEVYPDIAISNSDIRSKLKCASKCGSKLTSIDKARRNRWNENADLDLASESEQIQSCGDMTSEVSRD